VRRYHLLLFALLLVSAAGPAAQSARDAQVRRVLDSPRFKEAVALIDRDHDTLVNENIQLTEIPAPPFKEAARAKAFEAMLRQTGLTNIQTDPEGNVMGLRKGTGGGPLLAVAAHLDTGANHVSVQVLVAPGDDPMPGYRALARVLV